MDMLDRCDKLRSQLKQSSGMSKLFDSLGEYRKWWDKQGIISEGEDGWPLPFCFDEENVERFGKYWKGP